MTVAQWAETYRYLDPAASALPGRYSLEITPYLRGILEAITERGVRKVVVQKSAQVGYTEAINNFIGYLIHLAPCPVGVLFPREQSARDYESEKLRPMLRATPVLAPLVNVKTRSADNTLARKVFPGGFLKLVGSNSPSSVKSTPLKVVIVEEPDDTSSDVKGQGDSIKLAEERVKTFHDSKLLIGGTPSIKGVSAIEAEIAASDRRVYLVPCHECGESHVLDWSNVKWSDDAPQAHEVFGHARPETAFYSCPHCGVVWNDTQKSRNVRRGVWQATAKSNGVAGFLLNELVSSFPDSRMSRLVEKYLTARHEFDLGEPGALIAFTNSSLGLPYEYKGDTPDGSALSSRSEGYEEGTVPEGGLLLTAGVDVQHDRLAVIVRAWGRDEESWLVYWGEIYGQTVVPNAGAWLDLDALLAREWSGLRIRAASIDSSDGTTADAVYAFVRDRRGRVPALMAVKGASERDGERREIFSIPKPSIDVDKKSKAAKYGVKPYIVGTGRAKDLLLDGRVKLTGSGPGRLHWYDSVRPDYWEQLTAEVKAPHARIRGRKTWQKKAGARNEALDCEVYALHAARSLKTNLLRAAQWDALHRSLNRVPQAPVVVMTDTVPASPTPAPVKHHYVAPGRRQSIRDR